MLKLKYDLIVRSYCFFDNYYILTKTGDFGTVRGVMRRETSFGFVDSFSIEKHNLCKSLFKLLAQIRTPELKTLLERAVSPINNLLLRMQAKFLVSQQRNNIGSDVEEVGARITELLRELDGYVAEFPQEEKYLKKIRMNVNGPLRKYIDGLRIK